ncbi:MAG: NUMOD3 domain-containing DNA-binding protein, partial [Acidimicrobiia bacterium]
MVPEIEVLEEYDRPEDLPEAERFWIAYYRSLGCRLTNLTNGGDGASGRTLTSDARARIAAANKARGPISEETRRRMSESHRGRRGPMAEERRLKISKARGGRPFVDMYGNGFETLTQAAKHWHLRPTDIWAVLD